MLVQRLLLHAKFSGKRKIAVADDGFWLQSIPIADIEPVLRMHWLHLAHCFGALQWAATICLTDGFFS